MRDDRVVPETRSSARSSWRNRATDPGTPEPGEPPLPGFVRPVLIAVGAAQSAVALVLLLSPSTMIEHWPWELIPLTAQTLGGWFALPGVTALMMGLDGRSTGIRIMLEGQLIGLALILLGTIRAWEDVDTSNALAYVVKAARDADLALESAGAARALQHSSSNDSKLARHANAELAG